jgi:ABC-2 type transport system ATP-binding protein
MRKFWTNRAFLFLLVIVMIVPLFACTKPTATPEKPEETADLPEEKPDDSAKEDEEPEPKDELEFVTLDWYLGLSPMPDNQMVNDAVNEYLKEKVNANVNIHYWQSSDWETKMTTMISAGQDVGIIGFGSQSKLDYVVHSNRGSFYPLNDLLDEYGADTKALFPDEIWDCMRIDGNIYGIPSLKDNCYIISVIYNADMAEALEIDMESLEYKNWRNIEPFLEEVLAKRTEKFPEYDEYPLCGGAFLEMPYNFAIETFLNDSFMVACNIDPFNDIAGYDDNTVFNLYGTDEYREFCKSRQRMVEKNIFAYDYTDKSEWNYTGGMFAWGRIVGLLGPNASGKTTFIKLCNELLTPTRGEILIGGHKPGITTKGMVSYLPERTYLNDWMRVSDIIEFFKDFYDNFNPEKAHDMLGKLGINPKDRLKTMSKGTKEKVQLILVMSREADLYLLDEPIGGVDPAARDYILDTILSNYREDATVIISTHLISDIEKILDDVIFIKEGQVVLQKTVDEIREESGKSVDALFREVFRC